MPRLTAYQYACLDLLSKNVCTTSRQIADVALSPKYSPLHGADIALGLLRRNPPLVERVNGLHMWRITPAGRKALKGNGIHA